MPGRYEPSSRKAVPVIPIKLTDVREEDEYITEANKIKDVYLDKPYRPKAGNVGEVKSLREHILAMSLFPSVYMAQPTHRTFSKMKADTEDPSHLMKKRSKKEVAEGLD
jgi:hypothetical protein